MSVKQVPVEQACCFGSDCVLTGVYTPPANAMQNKPCAIYVTAGLLHHVGPTRLHVQMARALADDDTAGFRFDLSGVGDSETSTLGGYFLDRSVGEIQQAMDYLQRRYSHNSFVIVGLCSGADDALATAGTDQRVAGIVLLNGYAYSAGHFKLFRLLKFYLPRLFMPEKLLNRARKLLSQFGHEAANSKLVDQQALQALDSDYRYIPPKQETQTLLEQLARENVQMLFVYTGSEHQEYSYKGQLYAMFPQLARSGCVEEHYAQAADHTFILESDRNALIDQVRNWYSNAVFQRDTDDGEAVSSNKGHPACGNPTNMFS